MDQLGQASKRYLAHFGFGFVMFVSLASKKLDRYVLPAFPSLDLLAGLGLWTLGTWIVPYVVKTNQSRAARPISSAAARCRRSTVMREP